MRCKSTTAIQMHVDGFTDWLIMEWVWPEGERHKHIDLWTKKKKNLLHWWQPSTSRAKQGSWWFSLKQVARKTKTSIQTKDKAQLEVKGFVSEAKCVLFCGLQCKKNCLYFFVSMFAQSCSVCTHKTWKTMSTDSLQEQRFLIYEQDLWFTLLWDFVLLHNMNYRVRPQKWNLKPLCASEIQVGTKGLKQFIKHKNSHFCSRYSPYVLVLWSMYTVKNCTFRSTTAC